jgi:integrase
MKLNANSINSLSLPAGKTEAIFFDNDVPGFGIRLREGGSRTYVFQYKIGDKQRRIALGRTSAKSIGKARDEAEILYARVRLGADPAGDKAESVRTAAETFEAITARFLAHKREKLRRRSYTDVERHLLVHGKSLHALQLVKIDRRDIATCIAAVAKNSGAVTGNRVRATLSSFFSWSISQGLTGQNPVIGTTRHDEVSRDRVLDPAEIRLIWNSLEDDHYAQIIKLLMLTGQREAEVAGMLWSEIDLAAAAWAMPGTRTKNHKAHRVPLSGAALAIIGMQPRRANADGKQRDLIFGYSEGPFSGWSNSKEALDARVTQAAGKPLPHWTVHDLRRSFATHAAEQLQIQPHIIECILNHVSGFRAGVAGTYNRATYEPEMRHALSMWDDLLLSWAEDRESNVTPLRA